MAARIPLATADHRHGTVSGYTNHGCRCPGCALAGRSYYRERYRERSAHLRGPDIADDRDLFLANTKPRTIP